MNILKEKITDITDLIPQKYPFVMVDTLAYFSATEVVSNLTIASDNIFCDNNVLTEPGIIENMAQTVALHTGYDFFIKNEQAPTGYIGSVKKASVYKLPKLGETIITKATILHEFMGVTMVSIVVSDVEGKEIASSEMKTVIAN